MKIKKIEKQNKIVCSNFQLLSTGVNIKRLHNLILASPMKSYNTITQTIGRLMRLHPSKSFASIFDLVDNFPVFNKQFKHRCKTSYNSEEHPVKEINHNLFD